MRLTDILSFLKGSVKIQAEGLFLERFLNICMRRDIFLCDIKRKGENLLEATISARGFKKIRPIAKKTRTRVKIKTRSGMPFLIHRYRKRRFALWGILLFFLILWYLSSHLVGIDISGTERLKTAQLEVALKDFGVYRGARVKEIDRRLVQNRMMTKFEEIAWIGVNIKGSRAYIEVKERLDTKKNIQKDIPCNVVANKSGRIKEMTVREGQTMVKINDMVEEGELLISGVVDSGVMGIRYAHAQGSILAETTYKKTKAYPLEYTKKSYTQSQKARRTLKIGGMEIKLFLKKNQPFEYADKEVTDATYYIWKNRPLARIKTERFKEYVLQKVKLTEEEAIKRGREDLCGELEKEIGITARIIDKKIAHKKLTDKSIEVTAEYICEEDIARKSLIDKTDELDYNNTST